MNRILSLLLIVATTIVGVVPAVGVCESTDGSTKCCGHCFVRSSEATCCSKSVQRASCQCSVEQERPATPHERRTSDERIEARRADCVVAVLFLDDDVEQAHVIEDATLHLSQPTLLRQAVLCRWRI